MAKKRVDRRKNVEAGFWGSDGRFHPIRASRDYDPDRAGDEYGDFGSYGKRGGKKSKSARKKKNPPKSKGRAVRLSGFSGTVTKLKNGGIMIRGRVKKKR